jgi:hypothetical protein
MRQLWLLPKYLLMSNAGVLPQGRTWWRVPTPARSIWHTDGVEDPRVRRAKDSAKSALRKLFEAAQYARLDVLPRHFYSEVPDIRALRRSKEWRRPYSLVGVRGADLDEQLHWLRDTCPSELAAELPGLALSRRAGSANGALGYGPVEADLLYCLVRTRAPRRMIQIGAGASTWVALTAADDAGAPIDITCVDPYPTPLLSRLAGESRIHLRDVPVQVIPPAELTNLGPGDVLFIDSSHTVSPGSDVNFLVLEILPRLAKGVLVHLHDITIPYDYAPTLLTSQLFFWSESALLHAYLADNPRVRIRAGLAMLHGTVPDRLRQILPTYDRPLPTESGLAVRRGTGLYPTAMWLEVVADPTP